MSTKNPSVIDYFNPDGTLREEATEFEALDLEQYIDQRSKIKPDYNSAVSGIMQFDLEGDVEVGFYRTPSVVYGEIIFPTGGKTVLFKCRQKKNLTGFIRKVLEIASWPVDRIHTDFRITF